MDRWSRCNLALTTFAVIALLSGCTRPISDPVKLQAVKTESQSLAARHPMTSAQRSIEVPKSEWPPAIASLHPEIVWIHQWGVNITIKSYFDGGWGYDIPRAGHQPRMPAECYTEPSQGVFWHDPAENP